MDWLEQIAEIRIQEAIARGELDNLPGEGKPLRLEEDTLIPEELRVAYRILKNGGFLPPELQLRKDIAAAEQLLLHIEDTAERSRAYLRLQLLRVRLDAGRRRPGNLQIDGYYQKLLERLDHKR